MEEIEGYWISTCALCVNGEVKTKVPEQGTGVGERNRSLRRHNQRLAERHGEGVCNVTAPQGVGSGEADAVSAARVSSFRLSTQYTRRWTLSFARVYGATGGSD